MRNIEKEVRTTRESVAGFGYRPVTANDLRPGVEMVMVEVERYVHSGIGESPTAVGAGTVIRLDTVPVVPGSDDQGYVLYHCISPAWDSQCFVPAAEFLFDEAVAGPYGNDFRYFIKT